MGTEGVRSDTQGDTKGGQRMCEWSRRVSLLGGGFVTVAIHGLRIVITGDRMEFNAAQALGLLSAIKAAVRHVMRKDIQGTIADSTRDDVTPTQGGGDTSVSQPNG